MHRRKLGPQGLCKQADVGPGRWGQAIPLAAVVEVGQGSTPWRHCCRAPWSPQRKEGVLSTPREKCMGQYVLPSTSSAHPLTGGLLKDRETKKVAGLMARALGTGSGGLVSHKQTVNTDSQFEPELTEPESF